MERRKILLGSGTVLATALAGVSTTNAADVVGQNDENGGEDGNDRGKGKGRDKEKGRGRDEEKDEGRKKGKDGDDDCDEEQEGDGGEDENEGEDEVDVPGFEWGDCRVDTDVVRIDDAEYRDGRITVSATLTTTDRSALREELPSLGSAVTCAIRDRDRFQAAVEEVRFELYDADGNEVFSFFVDVQWLLAFADDDITAAELRERIREQMES